MLVFKVRDDSGSEEFFSTEAAALARRDSFRADGIDACAYRVHVRVAGSVDELVAALNGRNEDEEEIT
jgi:hypothetical protein